MLRRCFVIALALGALGVASFCRGQDTWQQETDRLATLLNGHPGDVVAEIGERLAATNAAARHDAR
ncbi:MAG TPA: hypothetical protein VMI06_14655 [Terriglobia bacterium]|nr:hypothetical protein [Terriglobia bacterium]